MDFGSAEFLGDVLGTSETGTFSTSSASVGTGGTTFTVKTLQKSTYTHGRIILFPAGFNAIFGNQKTIILDITTNINEGTGYDTYGRSHYSRDSTFGSPNSYLSGLRWGANAIRVEYARINGDKIEITMETASGTSSTDLEGKYTVWEGLVP